MKQLLNEYIYKSAKEFYNGARESKNLFYFLLRY